MSLNLNYQPEVLVSTEGLTEEEWLTWTKFCPGTVPQ